MNLLRKNAVLARLLVMVFAVQFLVPITATLAQSGNNNTAGFVICTSTGLKKLTDDGKLVPYDGDSDKGGNHSGDTCFVCLAGACIPVALLPVSPLLAILATGKRMVPPPAISLAANTAISVRQPSVRAPPIS